MFTFTKSRPKAKTPTTLLRVEGERAYPRSDYLATEEPLEIRLVAQGGEVRTVAVTMRTPGHDFELAAGFLFAEGIVSHREEIRRISYCTPRGEAQQYNVVSVVLNAPRLPELAPFERHFYTHSACGVCGRASLEGLHRRFRPLQGGPIVSAHLLPDLPHRLLARQALFGATGGLHAAALFDPEGVLLALREDVGRHNAVDKLLGWALLEGRLPLSECLLLVSGRASFELVQKALAGGVPILVALSAPSSLAVDLARAFHLTLVGFLRTGFNLYAAPERIRV
ncbi:MAG: formate dehydrogenase accessory sulfurtransferase FdhD [Meiothermus sp.]|uniref:formate dehydrogenase accessory sulfurtransferase FdhD n=1 Tax=Meiothermus sp. TaxID=1955249 RepID=UPI0025F17275|nr:formate dehydrogenase accessory sulfurtransferase FdhD [Meiothermus sp.]MCS7193854.1 formate dehydrogenase accessory sulfurtransferase FdhD [Meiothermus sp.]MCX7739547.1 formate dehydrogenase accessory sulfurtransferase FdhD [Meiothermus sp.]MDW8090314.1 formate dehydrogenase accessory sulfurtransferase FdhD [Meiothermus sp.]